MKKPLFISLIFFFAPFVCAEEIWEYDRFFQTPSGNIQCGANSKSGTLSRITHFETPRLRARNRICGLDETDEFSLSAHGKARYQILCHGGVLEQFAGNQKRSKTVLPYGTSISGKGWTCRSSKTGLRCTNRSRHGFVLSRSRQQLF